MHAHSVGSHRPGRNKPLRTSVYFSITSLLYMEQHIFKQKQPQILMCMVKMAKKQIKQILLQDQNALSLAARSSPWSNSIGAICEVIIMLNKQIR